MLQTDFQEEAESQRSTVKARSDEPHVGKYRLIKTIGKGNFAKVKLAKHVPTGQEVGKVCLSLFISYGTTESLAALHMCHLCLKHSQANSCNSPFCVIRFPTPPTPFAVCHYYMLSKFWCSLYTFLNCIKKFNFYRTVTTMLWKIFEAGCYRCPHSNYPFPISTVVNLLDQVLAFTIETLKLYEEISRFL